MGFLVKRSFIIELSNKTIETDVEERLKYFNVNVI